MNRIFAETVGTFFMVLAGTGAIVINQVTDGSITHVGIALTFGLVVMCMIEAFGDVSGAHLNPAVTLAFALSGRLPWRDVPGYALAQLCGAFGASLLLSVLFPESPTLGATIPVGAVWRSLVLEAILTFMLMLVILRVSSGPKEKGLTAGITIGGVIALEAMFAGPISGASMNPARSIAPAVVSGETGALWVYLVGPITGSALAVPAAAALRSGRGSRPGEGSR